MSFVQEGLNQVRSNRVAQLRAIYDSVTRTSRDPISNAQNAMPGEGQLIVWAGKHVDLVTQLLSDLAAVKAEIAGLPPGP